MDINDPNFDLDKYLKERIQEELKAAPPNANPIEPEPQGIEVKIGGQSHKFANTEELNTALEATFTRFQQELATAKAPIEKKPDAPLTGNEKPDWSMDQFIELMQKDPRDAFDYVDDHRESTKKLRASAEATEGIRRTIAVEQFRQKHPEFPITNAAAANLVDQTRQKLNLPYTSEGLEAAYVLSVNQNEQFRSFMQNHISQFQSTQAQPSSPQSPFSNVYPFSTQNAAPPSLGRSVNGVDNVSERQLEDFENLTLDQQERIISQLKSRR